MSRRNARFEELAREEKELLEEKERLTRDYKASLEYIEDRLDEIGREMDMITGEI